MIEKIQNETVSVLLEIFFEDGLKSSLPTEGNQDLNRKQCLYIIRQQLKNSLDYELGLEKEWSLALQEIERMSGRNFGILREEILSYEPVGEKEFWEASSKNGVSFLK